MLRALSSPPHFCVRRILFIGALLILPMSLMDAAWAQSDASSDTTSAERPPAFRAGGWGLQFRTAGLDGDLSGFRGSFVSGRYHVSPTSALRVGVSIDAFSQDSDVQQTRIDTALSPPEKTREETDVRQHDYELSGEYVYYYTPAKDFFLFASAGPLLGYRQEESTRTTVQPGMPTTEFTRETSSFLLGVTGGVGVEWYVHPHISLSAEYRFQFGRNATETTEIEEQLQSGDTARTEEESTSYRFGDQPVLVGVTFSFGP